MAALKAALRSAIVSTLKCAFRLTGETGRRLAAEAMKQGDEALVEVIETVETKWGGIRFYCLGDLSLWRARTLLTKEPETIEWIDDMQPGDVLWDIGANIGCYSLYAAKRGLNVIALEPGPANYFLLNKNIEINGFDDCVKAYCLAASDKDRLCTLRMSSTGFGGSLSTLGEHQTEGFGQGTFGVTLGWFGSFGVKYPNHIKLDVDGLESRILQASSHLLKSHGLKSLSVELDDDNAIDTAKTLNFLTDCGFKTVSKRHSPMFDNGKYANIFNYRMERHG